MSYHWQSAGFTSPWTYGTATSMSPCVPDLTVPVIGTNALRFELFDEDFRD